MIEMLSQYRQNITVIKQYISLNIVLIAENKILIVMKSHIICREPYFFYNTNEIKWERI